MKFYFYLMFFLCCLIPLAAVPSKAPNLEDTVPAGILMEISTGRLVMSWGEMKSMAPASLTKLMTMHLIFKAVQERRISWDQKVTVLPGEEASSLEMGASVMGLRVGDTLTVRELMTGLAVASGNDAGLVLARAESGTMANFVNKMNTEAQSLGMKSTVFYDSFGLSEKSQTTALEMARFCRFYIMNHPEATVQFHSQPSITYPGPNGKPLTQFNKNVLLGKYTGLDGLKTGHLEESGYHLAATAQRGNLRFLALIMGVQGANTQEGSEKRAEAARRLLDYGFTNYQLMELSVPSIPEVTAWYTATSQVKVVPAKKPVYLLSSSEVGQLGAGFDLPKQVLGPWPQEKAMGKLTYTLAGKPILTVSLVSSEKPEDGNFLLKIWHFIVLFFQGIFGGEKPVDLSHA